MFKKVYKNKRVLVTGHTGFKGSWLSIWLKELGAEVIGYSLDPPTNPSNFEACALKDRVMHIHGDVRDLNHLIATFKKYEPDFVFHLAAQPLVRLSYEEPKLTFDTNIGGTVDVLEAVRLTSNVKVLVNVTSDKCYENKEWGWGYRENDPMGGHDPYSASKGCSELIFAAYLKSFFSSNASTGREVGAASVRAGNVIGGGDWGEDRLIPDCVRALSKNKPIGIRNPMAVRPWQHVLEPLSGYLWLGALLWNSPKTYSSPWNFGPNDVNRLDVKAVVTRFIDFWGSGRWEDLSTNTNSVHEAKVLSLCCDKARTHLGWQSACDIDECLHFAADWYRRFYTDGKVRDMYDFCSHQIRQYTLNAKNHRLSWAD